MILQKFTLQKYNFILIKINYSKNIFYCVRLKRAVMPAKMLVVL